jgi:iron complex outermembrane receptor protein
MQKNEKLVRAFFFTLVMCCVGSAFAADPPVKTYQIGPQSVSAALKAFAAQADMQLIFTESDAGGAQSSGVTGKKSAREALQAILKGTGLEFEFTANNVVVVRKAAAAGLAAKSGDPPGDDRQKEGKSDSSQDFRVAPVDQTPAGPQVSERKENKEHENKDFLQEVVVTGSRIPERNGNGAQDVKVYTREQIDQSGQTSVAEFLSTLPEVSVASSESGFSTGPFGGGTTVQLHGLPLGTTLVLLNGRRIQSSGAQAGNGQDIFDLNNIPLGTVERIEVVSEGSSAIYGSDAIAGVVNIILKKDFDGFQANAKYGAASDTDETDVDLAWGHRWDRGSLSIVGTVQTRGELAGADRSVSANASKTATCNPGNVFSLSGANLPGLNAPYAAVPAGFTGTPTQQEFASTAGSLNECGFFANNSIVPATHRQGVFATGSLQVAPSVQLFFEAMYSHVLQLNEASSPGLFAVPGFQSYTVSASNPYNPFGEPIGVGYLINAFKSQDAPVDSNFFRPLLGARGSFFENWSWEASAWRSQDNETSTLTNNLNATAIQAALDSPDPSTALNPFTTASPGSAELLQSLLAPNQVAKYSAASDSALAFVRGPLATLPSGPMTVVLGAEYDRDSLSTDELQTPFAPPGTTSTFHRESYAVFAETRIPIFASHGGPSPRDILAVSLAGRFDHFDDFGSKLTPQFGLEWRPLQTLLVRGSFGDSFKAPPLLDLYLPQASVPTLVTDPLRGNQTVSINEIYGGNPNLRPETGRSHAIGVVYSSDVVPGLQINVTQWQILEDNQIQGLPPQTIIDNESLFPGLVTRGPSSNGQPGDIVSVTDIFLNFGEIEAAGFDYRVSYRHPVPLGEITAAATAVQTYHYTASLTPGSPAINAVSAAQTSGNWAPRWKGVLALGWAAGPFVGSVDGRYVGSYLDYNSTFGSTPLNRLGNFWLYDLNLRYAVGQSLAKKAHWMRGVFVEAGAVNLFNTLPQPSNSPFGSQGYDPVESDIRGRFLYARVGVGF